MAPDELLPFKFFLNSKSEWLIMISLPLQATLAWYKNACVNFRTLQLVSQCPKLASLYTYTVRLYNQQSCMHLSSIVILSVVGQAILAIPVPPPHEYKGSYPLLDNQVVNPDKMGIGLALVPTEGMLKHRDHTEACEYRNE